MCIHVCTYVVLGFSRTVQGLAVPFRNLTRTAHPKQRHKTQPYYLDNSSDHSLKTTAQVPCPTSPLLSSLLSSPLLSSPLLSSPPLPLSLLRCSVGHSFTHLHLQWSSLHSCGGSAEDGWGRPPCEPRPLPSTTQGTISPDTI